MLSELLELLYLAEQRLSSIQVRWCYWCNIGIMQHLIEISESALSSKSLQFLEDKSSEQIGSVCTMEIQRHIWWQKPDFWRDEYVIQGSRTIRIIRGVEKYVFLPGKEELYTNIPTYATHRARVKPGSLPSLEDVIKESEFLDPSFLLATHRFQDIEEVTYNSRKALRVKAKYRPGKTISDKFWSIADEYELVLDRERGVLLSYAALKEGEIFAEANITWVEFDISMPEEVFAINLQDNIRVFLVR